MRGVLFLCVANSARSQMAEAICRSVAPPGTRVYSAGSEPTRINPLAIRALQEIGLDASSHRAKSIAEVPADEIDTVVTLCAEEVCPVFAGAVRRLHWPLPDPAAATGDEAVRLTQFRSVRDELRRRISELFAKP
jgi:arsenate reductase